MSYAIRVRRPSPAADTYTLTYPTEAERDAGAAAYRRIGYHVEVVSPARRPRRTPRRSRRRRGCAPSRD